MVPWTSSSGVTWKAKATWLNEAQLIVAARNPSKRSHEAAPPKPAPISPKTSDSIITETTTGSREKPSARRVAISRDREDTAAYMVLRAANMAPADIMTTMIQPTTEMKTSIGSDWAAIWVVCRSAPRLTRGSSVSACSNGSNASASLSRTRAIFQELPR